MSEENSGVSVAPVDSEFPISSYTSLRFRSDNGVGEDGVVACVPRPYHLNSLGHFNISTPMKRTGELEMLLELAEGSVDADISRLEIVLERVKPRLSMHRIVCVLTQEAVKIHSKKTESTQETRDAILLNNRLGIKITRTGALEVFINGQNQGIVAQDFYKLGCDISYYASMLVPPGLALRLTAGGAQTEVINLEELCIDRVAECLHSPDDLEPESFPLPQHIKEKVAEVVFNPRSDSSFQRFY